MLYPYPIYRAQKRYITVGDVVFPKRGAVAVGDQILIASGAPCFQGHWGDTVEVEAVYTEYTNMREYKGVNGIGTMDNGRYQIAQYINLTTQITGSCFSWQLLDAQIT